MNLFFSENDIIFFKVKRFICAWEKAASDGSLFFVFERGVQIEKS